MTVKSILNIIIIFLFGGIGYNLIEIIWRGYTHISMTIAGGMCFLIMFAIRLYMPHKTIWFKATVSALAITIIEFIFGIIFNIFLGMNVWDYGNAPFNIMGQICLPYTLLWFLLSLIAMKVINLFLKTI